MERLSVSTASSTTGNSTLRPEANLHLEAPCTQRGATQETQRSGPSDGARGEATAEVQELPH